MERRPGGEEEGEEESGRPGVHGVSPLSWPCLCVMSSNEHNAQEEPRERVIRIVHTYPVHTRPSRLPRSLEETLDRRHDGEGRRRRVYTRVSGACWPCLRVMFIVHRSITRKKSQHS